MMNERSLDDLAWSIDESTAESITDSTVELDCRCSDSKTQFFKLKRNIIFQFEYADARIRLKAQVEKLICKQKKRNRFSWIGKALLLFRLKVTTGCYQLNGLHGLNWLLFYNCQSWWAAYTLQAIRLDIFDQKGHPIRTLSFSSDFLRFLTARFWLQDSHCIIVWDSYG